MIGFMQYVGNGMGNRFPSIRKNRTSEVETDEKEAFDSDGTGWNFDGFDGRMCRREKYSGR